MPGGMMPMAELLPQFSENFDAFVVGCAFAANGLVGLGLGDGTVRLLCQNHVQSVKVSEGAVLCFAANPTGNGFLAGTDTGDLVAVSAAGDDTKVLWQMPRKWVDQLAVSASGRRVAAAAGRTLALLDADGTFLRKFTALNTISGLGFDAKGKRVAAAHYNGVSLWFVAAVTDQPRILEWKGSHIGLAFHPEGEAVVTAMQENALHGWRLSDGQHMQMTGYPAKTESLAFTRGGKYLASSGADAAVLWPFFGGGPRGRAPLELGGGQSVVVTRVAAHPKRDWIALGFADGTLALADIDSGQVVALPSCGNAAISALGFSPDGACLVAGSEAGDVRLFQGATA
ncbi:MAG: WD40 repeat domain-containing protein [Acidocella sp.]|nr:WD40 repeat domain-containing protein [Acidocella sp.]